MKRFTIPFIILIYIGLSGLVGALYTWTGTADVGSHIYVNDLTLTVDQDNITKELALIIEKNGQLLGLLKAGESGEFQGLSISFKEFNGYGIISIQSEEFFTVSITSSSELEQLRQENTVLRAENEELKKEVQSLTAENKKLKQQVSELEKQLSSQPDVQGLQAQITNLTKENRELKAQIANLTNKVNQLKAENEFLSQQNEEYRTMIQNLLKETAQGSEQDYIEQAKKERLIGSVLLKSILFAGVIVGLIGYGLYKKKRGWELT
ncbi:hypothetical protein E3E26_06945 [Thermococcus sp. LS1]|uniref:hypothetical protein n=1 Tax=Thermococcus sp. LS1 TaxID=1638259 RepID=UPI00143A44EB|nr:hypothetical protein [Thermococcus sp. LS1]NJD99520.1 hypothetical protein [Thermococcus sp. LS1]